MSSLELRKDDHVLFLGDSIVLHGDSTSKGFISLLKQYFGHLEITMSGSGHLKFDHETFVSELTMKRHIEVLQPNVLVLMATDDELYHLSNTLSSSNGCTHNDEDSVSSEYSQDGNAIEDIYSKSWRPLMDIRMKLELLISHARSNALQLYNESQLQIVIVTPLITIHSSASSYEKAIFENILEIFNGMLKQVAHDYNISIIDIQMPLSKYYEHLRLHDHTVDMLDDKTLGPESHALIAYLFGVYFELDRKENIRRLIPSAENASDSHDERSGSSDGIMANNRDLLQELQFYVQPYLQKSGLQHTHLSNWLQDSHAMIRDHHQTRSNAQQRAFTAYERGKLLRQREEMMPNMQGKKAIQKKKTPKKMKRMKKVKRQDRTEL